MILVLDSEIFFAGDDGYQSKLIYSPVYNPLTFHPCADDQIRSSE